MAQSVSVSVEAPIENQILSIDYEGTELYQRFVNLKAIIFQIINKNLF